MVIQHIKLTMIQFKKMVIYHIKSNGGTSYQINYDTVPKDGDTTYQKQWQYSISQQRCCKMSAIMEIKHQKQ